MGMEMGMVEAPCSVAAQRRAGVGAHFRLPRHGLRRKLLVVRLGAGGAGGTRAGGQGLRRTKLRWLRSAMWRLAELCVAVMSGPPAPAAVLRTGAPSTGIEPYFVAPFLPAARC